MIDRYKLVNQHNPIIRRVEKRSPLTVGNGEFAFTADVTGLQSFPEIYAEEIPLSTMAQWGWHSFPAEKGEDNRNNLKLKMYQSNERQVPYASSSADQEEVFNYLRENPHKFHLGQIGLELRMANGRTVKINDITSIKQKLDIWQGILISEFKIQDSLVKVKTVCHPERDLLAVSIDSELIRENSLAIKIKFPYASIGKTAADWDSSNKHRTIMKKGSEGEVSFIRIMDEMQYFMTFFTSSKGNIFNLEKHYYQFEPTVNTTSISFTCEFSERPLRNKLLGFPIVKEASKEHWKSFWENGGIIDLSKSKDSRAEELERRVVLSQYLTAIQCSGSYPPEETGLTCNSWYGKFHLEMHFWHAAHFLFWDREEMLEKSLWWYYSILDKAKELAVSQGYEGARWPKMVGPAGYDSPSSIGSFLVWQQPHPIFYAELLYRIRPEKITLDYYKDIVFNSAQFMVSIAKYDADNDCFVLGPPLIPAQECYLPEETLNPTLELEYWNFALKIAQEWRKRLGLDINSQWQEVIDKLAELPKKDGVYLAHEKCPNTFDEKNYDHPSMLGAYGVLPGERVDSKIMLNTLKRCVQDWQFTEVWGWDFPLMAMTAARLGETELALDLLLMDTPKNTYLANGHNRQGDRKDLPLYLPGNGALLLAVGMMAAGWKGSENTHAPGFPDNNLWNVKYEGIREYI